MPVYDYKCRDHGVFSELATLADAEKPQPCPRCGALAGRVIRLPPALAALTPAARAAHARNEKSRHAPDTLSARRADDGRHGAAHRARRENLSQPQAVDDQPLTAIIRQIALGAGDRWVTRCPLSIHRAALVCADRQARPWRAG